MKILIAMGLAIAGFWLVTTEIAVALPADAPAGGTIQQRIDLRKKERGTKLSEKDLVRLKGRCIAAQTNVREIQGKLGTTISKRQATHKKIDAKLWITIGQLKLADKDTFVLEKQRAELAQKVAAYDNKLNQYKQTLDDIVVMNCQADLNGFMALVETAREYHKAIREDSAAIKTYVVDTIKKKLSEFATELQPKPSTETEENN